jgi:hypothetical protein
LLHHGHSLQGEGALVLLTYLMIIAREREKLVKYR